MAKVRIVVNRKGVRELLRSPEILADLERRAENIASAAGPGHEVDSQVGPRRARASVRTDTIDAMLGEAESHTLTRSLDAGRD